MMFSASISSSAHNLVTDDCSRSSNMTLFQRRNASAFTRRIAVASLLFLQMMVSSNMQVASAQEDVSNRRLQSCTDYPEGWNSALGSRYDCNWFAVSDRCKYKDRWGKDGYTAATACCACGGGHVMSIPEGTEDTDTVTKKELEHIVNHAPLLDECQGDCDHDHDCKTGLKCFVLDNPQEVPGCSGIGVAGRGYCYLDQGQAQLVNKPTAAPTTAAPTTATPTTATPTTPAPTPATPAPTTPVSTSSTRLFCSNTPEGWHDSGGTKYNCDWYNTEEKCNKYGHSYQYDGLVANDVCCQCGGGSKEAHTFSNMINNVGECSTSSCPQKFHRCEGDCDSDSECMPGLVCLERSGSERVPGCYGAAEDGVDYCIDPSQNVLTYFGETGPHGRCEGDCDSHSDCKPGLKCFFRSGLEPVPGCEGLGASGRDYCYSEQAAYFLDSLRYEQECTSSNQCDECHGDCLGNDDNCADGLSCFSRTDGESVPGCVTGGPGDISGADYCYRKPLNGPVTYVPGDLTVKEFGLRLSTGLTSRIVARSGERVEYVNGHYSSDVFHSAPDGAAVFKDPNSANWVYVSNSEMPNDTGGVGAITFNEDGNVIDYKMLLTGTTYNCGGGMTFWNTWVSCEEAGANGQIWEVDPFGNGSKETIMGGTGGNYESVAYDNRDENNVSFYITEDASHGALVKFTPDAQAMAEAVTSGDYSGLLTTNPSGTMKLEYLVLNPSQQDVNQGTFFWSSSKDEGKTSAYDYFQNCEGIDVRLGRVYFTCKTDKILIILDLDAMTYERSSTVSGAFDSQPDQIVRVLGDGSDEMLYFCEDARSDSGVHARDTSGNFFTIIDGQDYSSEATGLAFSPEYMFMYISYQQAGLIFEIRREDGYPFGGQRLDIKYHAF